MSQASSLLSIVFAMLPILLVFRAGGAIQPERVVLGVLEDVPGSYAGEPNSRRVRVLFRKNGDRWEAFPSECPDEACLKSLSSKYPGEITWTIAFDGRDLGRVTGRTPKEFDLYSHIGLQDVISAGPIRTVGKRSAQFSGFLDTALYRPLVAVSEPNVKDPETWKPSQPPAAVISLVRQQFRKRFPAVSNCAGRTTGGEKPLALQGPKHKRLENLLLKQALDFDSSAFGGVPLRRPAWRRLS